MILAIFFQFFFFIPPPLSVLILWLPALRFGMHAFCSWYTTWCSTACSTRHLQQLLLLMGQSNLYNWIVDSARSKKWSMWSAVTIISVGNWIKCFWLVDPSVFKVFFGIKLKIGSLNNQIIKSDLSTFFLIYHPFIRIITRSNEAVELVEIDFMACIDFFTAQTSNYQNWRFISLVE